jgi:hypothetical protein
VTAALAADRYDVRLATAADEPDVRALVGSVAMPGTVAIRFAREPDYFLGATIMGDPCDVVVVRDRATGRLAGFGCRAERRAFVNGREERIGYLGQIRAADGYRGRWLLQRALAWLRAAGHDDLLYCGVVARENPRAREVLVGRRPPGGMWWMRLAGLTTCAIVVRDRRRQGVPGLEVDPAEPADLEGVAAFLRREGRRRQLFPVYDLAAFTGGTMLRGLTAADIAVARRRGSVVGVMAAWDQGAYKQDVVDAYGPSLRRLRPAWDVAARLLGAASLTPPGMPIPLSFAALTCVAGDDPVVMRALVGACAERARTQGKAFLMIGLADEDPLLAVARRWLHVTYRSDLFVLSWRRDPATLLDGRPPYVEIATL